MKFESNRQTVIATALNIRANTRCRELATGLVFPVINRDWVYISLKAHGQELTT